MLWPGKKMHFQARDGTGCLHDALNACRVAMIPGCFASWQTLIGDSMMEARLCALCAGMHQTTLRRRSSTTASEDPQLQHLQWTAAGMLAAPGRLLVRMGDFFASSSIPSTEEQQRIG